MYNFYIHFSQSFYGLFRYRVQVTTCVARPFQCIGQMIFFHVFEKSIGSTIYQDSDCSCKMHVFQNYSSEDIGAIIVILLTNRCSTVVGKLLAWRKLAYSTERLHTLGLMIQRSEFALAATRTTCSPFSLDYKNDPSIVRISWASGPNQNR